MLCLESHLIPFRAKKYSMDRAAAGVKKIVLRRRGILRELKNVWKTKQYSIESMHNNKSKEKSKTSYISTQRRKKVKFFKVFFSI